MTFEEIRQTALALPGVEEHLIHGGPTFRVGKRFLACIAKIDSNTLVVKVADAAERAYLLATRPEIYYLTEHYASFEALLVRTPRNWRGCWKAWRPYARKRLVTQYQGRKP